MEITYPENIHSFIIIIIFVCFSLWIARYIKRLPLIILWLLGTPIFVGAAVSEGIVKVEGIYQFVLLGISYVVIWWRGVYVFEPKQYKAALSFIGASIATILTIVAYLCFDLKDTKFIDMDKGDLPKVLSIIVSPWVIAGLWGRFFIDLKDMLHKQEETLGGCLKDYILVLFPKGSIIRAVLEMHFKGTSKSEP